MPPRPTLKVVGRRLEPEDYRLRDFFTRTAQPHEFYEAGTPQADAILTAAGAARAALPVVVDGDTFHAGATVEGIANAWSIHAHPDRTHYDLFIVGAGPAGLAAAVYGASDGLSTAVAEADVPGGQASYTSAIENFFGFVEPIGGAELARLAGRQAERFGAELLLLNGVVRGHLALGQTPTAELSSGDEVTSDIVIVAPGMEWRRLELDGVEELLGHGVYYGAGRSEAVQCSGEHVVVVGGGNSAGQAVMNMATAGARVTQVVRGDSLAKSMSAYLVERIDARDDIEVRLRSQVTAVHEQAGRLGAVTIESADSRRRDAPRRLDVPVHRRRAAHRLGAFERRADGPQRLPPHRTGPAPGRQEAGRLAARPRPARTRDEHSGRVRCRRRAPRLREARRGRGRRGLDGRCASRITAWKSSASAPEAKGAQLFRCYGVPEAGLSPARVRPMEASALRQSAALPALAGRSPLLRLQSDERLVALTRRGHHGAFEALVQRYQPRLLAFCRHMLGSQEDAEDVLQEVFAASFNAMLRRRPADQRAPVALPDRPQPLPQPPAPPAARGPGLDGRLRARRRRTTTADTVHKREEFRQIVADVQELPETQRTALLLREIDALSYDQIAEAMDTTVPSVKSLLVRARVSLAEAAEARLLTCDEVRLELGQVAEGLARTSAPVRRHLKSLRPLPHLPRRAAQDHARRSPRSTRSARWCS